MKFRCKKLLSLILALVMLMSVVSCSFGVLGAETGTVVESGDCSSDDGWSNVTWSLYDDGTLVISGEGRTCDYSAREGDAAPWHTVTYNSQTDSYDVTNTTIKKVIVEEGVSYTGYDLFIYLEEMESISLPDTLSEFMGVYKCPKLTTFNIPESLWNFSGYLITDCPSLKTVEVSEENGMFFTDETGSVYKTDGEKTELFCCLAATNGFSTYTVPEFVDTIWADRAFSANKLPLKIVSHIPDLEIINSFGGTSITEIEGYPYSDICMAAEDSGIPAKILSDISITDIKLESLPEDLICQTGAYLHYDGMSFCISYSDGKSIVTDSWRLHNRLSVNYDTSSVGTKTVTVTLDSYTFTYDIEVHDKHYLTEGVKYTTDIDNGGEKFFFSPSTTGAYEIDFNFEEKYLKSFYFVLSGDVEQQPDGSYTSSYLQDFRSYDSYPYNYLTMNLEAGKEYSITCEYFGRAESVDVTFRPVCDHSAAQELPTVLPTCTTDGHMAGTYCSNCDKAISGYDVIKAFHWDKDEDGLCDTCSEEVTDNLEDGKKITAFLKKNGVVYLQFTPDETSYYKVQTFDCDQKSTLLDENMNELVSFDFYENDALIYNLEAGKTYYAGISNSAYDVFAILDITLQKLDNYNEDDDDGDDDWEDYPDQITLNGSIGLGETLTLDFDEANTRWLLEFTPDETGIYSFYSLSDSDTYGMLYNGYMDWLTDNDDYENLNFKVTYELQGGETYYWAAKYLSEDETGSFAVTLTKASRCDYYGHIFTDYVYNNDATETVDGTKTAECDNGCGETDTVTAYGTATNPTIIDIYPGETKTATVNPGENVVFRAHSADDFENTEYWYYLSDENESFFDVYWYDAETKEAVDGGMGDEYFSFVNEKDKVYHISVGTNDGEETTATLYMHPHSHSYEFVRTYLPNCCEDGYDIYRCECGKEKYDNYVPTDYECNYELVETRQPDCSDGYDYYECRGCWDGYKDNIIPGSGNHTFSNYTSNNDATCYSDGTKTGYCDVCDTETVITDEGSMVTHRYSNFESNGDGTKTGYCIFDCGESYTIADVGESYDFEYYISDSKVTITKYTGDNTEVVVVPEEIEGYPVVIMLNDALSRDYEDDFRIDTIFLPKTLTNIDKVSYWGAQIFVDEDNPYYSNDEHGVLFNKDKTTLLIYPIRSSLSEYVIPDTVTKIANSSFVMAFNLTYVEIPDSVKIIGDSAFDMCVECDFSVGKNIEYVGCRAFFMTKIKNVAFGNNLKYMGEYSFLCCNDLEEIILPAEFETESYIFEENHNLRHIGFMGNEEQWAVIARRSPPEPEYLHLNYDPETAIVTERTEPTCDEEGKEIVKCSCGYVISEDYIDPLEHSFTNYVSDNNSTISGHGTKTAYCDFGCGAWDTILEAPIESIEIVTPPEKTNYIFEFDGWWDEVWYYDEEAEEDICEEIFRYELQSDGMEIKVNFSDGVSEIFNVCDLNNVQLTGQQNNEIWEIGSHEVSVEYFGKTATFDIKVIENPVESIEVYTLPYKTEYIHEVNGRWDERWDDNKEDYVPYFRYNINTQGLKIKVNYKDGTSEVFNYYNLEGLQTYSSNSHYGQTWNVGTHEMTVEYCKKTATFDVEIVENNIKNIEIVSEPVQTEYIYEKDGSWFEHWEYDEETGEDIYKGKYYLYSINTDGIKIKLNNNDGTSEVVDIWNLADTEIISQRKSEDDPPEIWGIGTHTATVKYGPFTADFDIEIIEENPVAKLELVYFPERAYMDSEYIDLRGAKFKLTYSDGTEEIIETTYENYYNARYSAYSFDMGYIDGQPFYIGPCPENNTATTRCFQFEYSGHRLEINVPRSDLKVVSTEITTKPEVTLSGTGVKLTLSDSSVIETTILCEDYRAGDGDVNWEARVGYICTEYGIILGELRIDDLFEPEKTRIKYFRLGESSDQKEYTDFYDYFNVERIGKINEHIENYNKYAKSGDVDFYGEITADNIDALIYTATSLVGYKYDHFYHEYTADAVKNAVKDIFSCDEIDLTLSKYYNETTGIYKTPNVNYYTVYRNRSYTTEQTPVGTGVITRITDDYTEEAYYLYVIFDEASKVVYWSDEKWNFPEDEDNTFVDESTGVEIEHPSQPGLDFDIENIEGGSDQFLLIEEVVADNLSEDWEVLKAFDITLKNKDGVHVQPDGTVKVKLPLDWEKDGNYKVYRVNDDGTLTDMNAYRQGSHMVFETDHFSVYIIVEENTEAPDEGDGNNSTASDFISQLFLWLKELFELLTSFLKAIA